MMGCLSGYGQTAGRTTWRFSSICLGPSTYLIVAARFSRLSLDSPPAPDSALTAASMVSRIVSPCDGWLADRDVASQAADADNPGEALRELRRRA